MEPGQAGPEHSGAAARFALTRAEAANPGTSLRGARLQMTPSGRQRSGAWLTVGSAILLIVASTVAPAVRGDGFDEPARWTLVGIVGIAVVSGVAVSVLRRTVIATPVAVVVHDGWHQRTLLWQDLAGFVPREHARRRQRARIGIDAVLVGGHALPLPLVAAPRPTELRLEALRRYHRLVTGAAGFDAPAVTDRLDRAARKGRLLFAGSLVVLWLLASWANGSWLAPLGPTLGGAVAAWAVVADRRRSGPA